MSAADNKSLLQAIFAETAIGNGKPFVEALADDVRWTIIGSTAWSGTYNGKSAVLHDLLFPLGAQMAAANVTTASTYIAEGDAVVVEGEGRNTTKAGQPYNNRYCWVFRFHNGMIASIVEYADTALIDAVLQPPVPGAR